MMIKNKEFVRKILWDLCENLHFFFEKLICKSFYKISFSFSFGNVTIFLSTRLCFQNSGPQADEPKQVMGRPGSLLNKHSRAIGNCKSSPSQNA